MFELNSNFTAVSLKFKILTQYKSVRFLYIASTENDDPVTARTWMSEKEIEGEALFITPNDWAALMGFLNFSATPSTFLIDTDGNVDNKHYTIPDLEKRIEELLK